MKCSEFSLLMLFLNLTYVWTGVDSKYCHLVSPVPIYDRSKCALSGSPCLHELLPGEDVNFTVNLFNPNKNKSEKFQVLLKLNGSRHVEQRSCQESSCVMVFHIAASYFSSDNDTDLVLEMVNSRYEKVLPCKASLNVTVKDYSNLTWCSTCPETSITDDELNINLSARGYPSASVYQLSFSNGTLIDSVNRSSNDAKDKRDVITIKKQDYFDKSLTLTAIGREHTTISRSFRLEEGFLNNGLVGHSSNDHDESFMKYIIGALVSGLASMAGITVFLLLKRGKYVNGIICRSGNSLDTRKCKNRLPAELPHHLMESQSLTNHAIKSQSSANQNMESPTLSNNNKSLYAPNHLMETPSSAEHHTNAQSISSESVQPMQLCTDDLRSVCAPVRPLSDFESTSTESLLLDGQARETDQEPCSSAFVEEPRMDEAKSTDAISL